MPNRFATQLPGCTVDAVVYESTGLACPKCLLREFGACSAVHMPTFEALNQRVQRKHYAAHETIVSEADNADAIGVVSAGVAAVVKYSHGGRRQIIGFLEPGDVFGLSSGDAYFADVEALSDVSACLFSRASFDDAMREHPELSPEVMRIVSNERVEAAEHELLLGQFSGRERLAAFLLRRAERFGKPQNEPLEIKLETTRRDIGDYLGLSMENVSRGINEMAKAGIVSIPSPRRIVIEDLERLRTRALPED